jgi:tetratricopeptide (TPR) repeat protein
MTLEAEYDAARAMMREGRFAEAVKSLRALVESVRKAPGVESAEYAALADVLAEAFVGLANYDEAADWRRVALQTIRQFHKEESEHVGVALMRLADVLVMQGKYEAAEEVGAKALAKLQKTLPATHKHVLDGLTVQARVALSRGRVQESVALSRRVLEGRLFEGEAVAVLTARSDLTQALTVLGDLDEAEQSGREAVRLAESLDAREGRHLVSALGTLGVVLIEQRRITDAEPVLRRALALQDSLGTPEASGSASLVHHLAVVLAEQGRCDEADALAGRSRAMTLKRHGAAHPHYAEALVLKAQIDAALGRESAKDVAVEALGILVRSVGEGHWRTVHARRALEGIERGLHITANDSAADVLVKTVKQAELAMANGESERAVEALEPLLQALPEGLEVVQLRGGSIVIEALLRMHRWDDALAALGRVESSLERGNEELRAQGAKLGEQVRDAVRQGKSAAYQSRIRAALAQCEAGQLEGVRALEDVGAECERDGHHLLAASARVLLGRLYLSAGMSVVARPHLEAALVLLERSGDTTSALAVREMLAQTETTP